MPELDKTAKKEMLARDVTELLELFQANEIEVWVDGGWGVDALIGEQTRQHDDLDIAIAIEQANIVRKLLYGKGYRDFEDEMPTCLDLRDAAGRRVDLHPLTFDKAGNGLQQLQDGTFGKYTAQGLSGTGKIAGVEVNCLSPELQIKFHLGYEADANDYHDVRALREKFGIPLPSGYEKFIDGESHD